MNRFIKDRKKTDWYKIIARAIGFLVCAFFLTFIVGEGIPDIIKGKGDELIPFLPFVLLPIAGFIVAWVRPLAGALMMITGSLILLAYLIMGGNIKAALIYSIPFMIPGLLFLLQVKMGNRPNNKV